MTQHGRRAANVVLQIAYWTVPSLLMLWLYWYGLKTWFLQDDFAWLGLHLSIYTQQDFWRALFHPYAQGTVRFLSERGFFLLFEYLFGLDALPFRIWVFLTQAANLVLIAHLTWRLTGSRLAGFLAPLLWMVNNSLGTVMSWTSSYNQSLCAFFLLAGCSLFLRFLETGKKRYYFAQFVMFLLGFGALELNVVYPILVAGLAWLVARRFLVWTVPMFVVSLGYFLLHRAIAPRQTSGSYALHFDRKIFHTFDTYVHWALGPQRLELIPWGTEPLRDAMYILLLVTLLGFLGWQLWKRQWAAGWFVLWFLVVLGPLLPLRDHVSEYYLTIPTIGLAMLGGWGLAEATRAGWGWRLLAVLVFVTYTWSNAAMARVATRYNFERGRLAKAIVLGVERVLELHPGKIVLLHGIDKDAFYAGVADYPFRLFRATDIYLTPESQKNIGLDLETYWGLALPQPALVKALRQERGVVYQLEGDQLRNVTRLYTAQLAPASSTLSSFVRLGQPLFSDQLGPEWYPIDQGFRWMPGKATVRLAPLGSVLVARGWVPEQVVQSHPEFTIRVGESTLVRQTLTSSGGFEVTAKIPDNFRSLPELLIQLECSKTWVPDGDGRQLCAAFDHIAIR